MKHGLYTKGDLCNMENLQYDSNVRAAFEDYDKPRISDFFKHHQYATLGVLSVLAFVLSFLGDKLAVYPTFAGMVFFCILAMTKRASFTAFALSVLTFSFIHTFGSLISKRIRVKCSIKRYGGYITTGRGIDEGSGKNRDYRCIFTDAMGNSRNVVFYYEAENIIIAHSTFNDVDIICLNHDSIRAWPRRFNGGVFIGPCKEIDLNNIKENPEIR